MEVIFDNVSYTYQDNTPLEHKVLKNLNVKLEKNKINAIIGPSGSGKTTFIELINALLIPTNGKVMVGEFVLDSNIKKSNLNILRFNAGLVFQFPEEQFFQPTVEKEIGFAMKHLNYTKGKIKEKIGQALEMVSLDESYLDRNPFELSYGEKRKIAIASILVFDPKIVILDEPTVGLDSKGKRMLTRLIRDLKFEYDKTIILVSHDADMLYKIADNVIALNNGGIVCSGDKFEVFRNIKVLKENNIAIPKIVEFSDKVKNKNGLNLGNYCEVNDFIKAIYKNV